MSTATAWEPGLTCDADGCGGEFQLGEDFMWYYGRKLHQRCAAADASSRREASGEDGDVLEVARRILSSGERVILTRRQLRDLVTLAEAAGAVPVRRPDTGRHEWYSRMRGWSAERVKAGLDHHEVAGMWLDFIEVGRMPPLRARDLLALTGAIEGSAIACLATTGAPQKGQEPRDGGMADD